MTRTRSYEEINYRLRPAKCIERKLLCEAFRRLAAFGRLDSYRYVGMGSTSFRDFVLIHRALGISDMVSIERDQDAALRFELNLPYNCITMHYGETTDVLPKLDWSKRSIVWLDYDGGLSGSVLADVALVCGQALSGSIIVVSVNAHTSDDHGKLPVEALEEFKSSVGAGKFPPGLSAKDFAGWGAAAVIRRMLTTEVREAITNRNGMIADAEKMKYAPLFNYNYRDGARMCTIGGVIYSSGEASRLERCEFDSVPGIAQGEEPVRITVPTLTLRELQHLDAHLPPVPGMPLPPVQAIRKRDVEAYAAFYRFFPVFSELDY